MTNMDEWTLKEVLLSVSKKLDAFIEAHATLHTVISNHQTKVETLLEVEREAAIKREAEHEAQATELKDLRDWQTEVKGQLKLLRWMTGGGLIGAAALVLKLLGVPLP